MDKVTKEKIIAKFLLTEKGHDKLGMAIAKSMFNIACTPGPTRDIAKVHIDALRTDKTMSLNTVLDNYRKSKN